MREIRNERAMRKCLQRTYRYDVRPVGGQVIDPQPEQPLPPLAFPVLSLSQFKQPTLSSSRSCVQSELIDIVEVASFERKYLNRG